jgi:hypothetical protein
VSRRLRDEALRSQARTRTGCDQGIDVCCVIQESKIVRTRSLEGRNIGDHMLELGSGTRSRPGELGNLAHRQPGRGFEELWLGHLTLRRGELDERQ